MVSLTGFYRAPVAAEIMNSIAKKNRFARHMNCEAFAVVDLFVGRYLDISTVNLLSNQKIQYKGKPIQLLRPENISSYDYILATDQKSWSVLNQIASPNITTKIELFGLYNPYEKILDFPDIFFESKRGDGGRRLRWAIDCFRTAAKLFIENHYEEIKYLRHGDSGPPTRIYETTRHGRRPATQIYNDSDYRMLGDEEYFYTWNITSFEDLGKKFKISQS